MLSSLLALLLTLSAVPVAPSQTAALEGFVVNPHGSSAFVTVTAVSANKRLIVSTITDLSGWYAFTSLPAGKFEIIASKNIPNIGQTSRTGVRLQRGQATTFNITLPMPLENYCNCSCPVDPSMQYNGNDDPNYPDRCSPCPSCNP